MFFNIRQNNSGGRFGPPAINVIVEADDWREADAIAAENGVYLNGVASGYDCSCCGDRWHSAEWEDGKPEPMIYGKSISDYMADSGMSNLNREWAKQDKTALAVVFYKDGSEAWYS